MAASNSLTPAERTMRSSAAAHVRWANEPDRQKATEPARRANRERFDREVDPDGTLDPAIRAKLAENARKAYYTRLAFQSAKARRLRKEAAKARREAGST